MFALTTIQLPAPISIYLPGSRPRVVSPSGETPPAPRTGDPVTLEELQIQILTNPVTKTIHAQVARIPAAVLLYGGAEDFAAAAADTPEEHGERLLQVLGNDPAEALQRLCDGLDLPPLPPRVPREIPNWRCKAVLLQMGLLGQVEAIMDGLPEPDRTVARLAWQGDGKVARRGKTVIGLAAALGLSEAQVDAMFVAAEAIEV